MKKLFVLIFTFIFYYAPAQNPLIKQWDYRFGGTDQDFLNNFQQTSDGGFILAGFSQSPVSGDKSKNTRGIWDYWLVKIDALGLKQWDKDLGGTEDDRLYSMQQTTDGGYILGGSSNSGLNGDKTEANWDSINFTHDFWIIKTDTNGNRIWDKDIGGLSDDNLVSIQQTSDGGFIVGGSSNSGIGGHKTHANWDSLNYTSDFWILKLNSSGQIVWDKRYGTTTDDQLIS
ncbi:MAG: T9SS C-terminal target domain-containing protein, partial [Bacteroidota bacterium]